MQTLFILNLEQSSQLLRILLITTTLAALALGHSILATQVFCMSLPPIPITSLLSHHCCQIAVVQSPSLNRCHHCHWHRCCWQQRQHHCRCCRCCHRHLTHHHHHRHCRRCFIDVASSSSLKWGGGKFPWYLSYVFLRRIVGKVACGLWQQCFWWSQYPQAMFAGKKNIPQAKNIPKKVCFWVCFSIPAKSWSTSRCIPQTRNFIIPSSVLFFLLVFLSYPSFGGLCWFNSYLCRTFEKKVTLIEIIYHWSYVEVQ